MSRTRHKEKAKRKQKLSNAGKYCDRMDGKCDHSCDACQSERRYKQQKRQGIAGNLHKEIEV